MKKNIVLIILILLFFLALLLSYQCLKAYISESLVIVVKNETSSKIKDIKTMFNIEESTLITKMIYTPGFPEGFNLEVITYNEKEKTKQHLFFYEASAYSEKQALLEYYFKSDGKSPIYIYILLLILNTTFIIILSIYLIKNKKR